MDLSQTKLSKGEWESIEVPVAKDELSILKMFGSKFCCFH